MLRKGIHGSEPPKAKTHRFLRQLDSNGFPQIQDFGFKTVSVDDFNVENQIKRGALGKSSVRISPNTPIAASDGLDQLVHGLPPIDNPATPVEPATPAEPAPPAEPSTPVTE